MDTISRFFNRFTTTTTTTRLIRILMMLAIAIISVTVFFFWWSDNQTEQALVEQTLHREQVIARAGAKSIGSFIFDAGKSINVLAINPRLLSMDSQAQDLLKEFMMDWKGTPLVGAILVNREGKVILNTNNLGIPFESGVSVSDRDYFIWAKKAKKGELFLDKPVISRLGTTKGQYIVPIATPIFQDEEFKGVLGGSILLSKLIESFLDPLKISNNTRIYLINSEGSLLTSPNANLVGVNYIDYLKNKPFAGSEAVIQKLNIALEEKKEGKLDVNFPNERKKGILERFLIAYSPVDVSDRHWLLAVATPIDDVLLFFGPFQTRLTARTIFELVSLLIVVLLFVFGIRIVQRVAYLEGFTEGRDHHDGK